MPEARSGGDKTFTIGQSSRCHTDLANAQAQARISVSARYGRDPGVALANGTTRVLMQAANLPVGFQHPTTLPGRFREPP
jgi:hypothetical protein